jgi:xylose dehydrogenase (NAD/NADP)
MVLSNITDDLRERDWATESFNGEVRFALIGLGWFTREAVLPAITGVEMCRPTVVVTGSKEKSESVMDAYDSVERSLTYDQFHEGDAVDSYDAVYVCTPNAYHLPFVESAASLGKSVLCEKPVEATVERAKSLVAAANDADIPLMVAYRMQTDPVIRRLREFVADGGIGEPLLAHGSMTQTITKQISGDPDQWRLDADVSGGCALIDLGIYPLNTLRFMFDADPLAVSGMTASPTGLFAEVDEHATFEVEFDNGLTASLTASQNAFQSSHLSIIGSEGRITVDPAFFGEVHARVETDGGDVTLAAEDVDEVAEEFAYFARCVLTETDPYADGEHALTDMYTVDAIYHSAETDDRVWLRE